jgi:hypothetical protein
MHALAHQLAQVRLGFEYRGEARAAISRRTGEDAVNFQPEPRLAHRQLVPVGQSIPLGRVPAATGCDQGQAQRHGPKAWMPRGR